MVGTSIRKCLQQQRNQMRKILIIIVIISAGYAGLKQYGFSLSSPSEKTGSEPIRYAESSDSFGVNDSQQQIQGKGIVIKLLPDDNDGSRHQKFIIKLGSGQKLLVAHNIDLAPRVSGIQVGDSIGFHGQYEWNSKGGVVHWTHHDPQGRHAAGWLEHENQIYQ